MGLFAFLALCVVVGVVVWAIVTFVPMPAPIKQLVVGAAVVVLVLIFLNALFGLGDVAIPRIGG